MSAGTVSRDQWIETMEPTLLELFTAGLDKDSDWKKVWIQKKSNKRREEILEWRKPDVVVETPEGSPYVELSVQKVKTASVVHADYTGMIRITHQMQRDKQYDDMMEHSWGLGESIGRKLYEDAVNFYINGFDSVTSPVASGNAAEPWFYDAHVLQNGQGFTGNNLLTPQSLSPDSFNSGQVLMMKTRNENGKITPYGTGRLQLIVPADSRRLGLQLTKKGTFEPGNADHNENVFDIDLVCLPMLAQTSASWASTQFFLRDPQMAKNYFFLREGPVFDTFRDPYTDDVVVKARISYSFLVGSWRGIVGCKGA